MKKSFFGKTLVVLFAFLLNAQSVFAIVENPTNEAPKSETVKKYEEIIKEWDSSPYAEKSYLQYTELKMLQEKMKKDGETLYSDDFRDDGIHVPTGNRFLGNSFSDISFQDGTTEIQDILDILLGTRAIQESLQIESIGSNENSDKEEQIIDISSINSLEIASHDYQKMIEDEGLSEKIQIPESAKLAPDDVFFVSFESEKLLEFSNVIEQYSKDFSKIYETNLLPEIKTAIMNRLGLPEDEEFLGLTSEIAFVSEDLDFLGKTDFALIVKFKDSNSKYIAKMLQTGENAFEQVGDFFVFASHKNLIERIKETYQEQNSSLAQAKDFQYALGSLDSRKNGVLYFSDTFIRKLTSPAYRINARRKNTVFNEFSNLQYIIFSYKDLEGTFPKTFTEIAEKSYLSAEQKSLDEIYTISPEGEVSHAQWGTLRSMTPVSRVPIEKISESEKELYGRFRTEYNQFFQEFFDPIGVAIMVSDRIAFQTIILPLIDNSEYNWVKAIFGGNANTPFDFVENPDRETSFAIMSKLSFDDFLAMVGKEMVERDPNDSTRRNDLYNLQSGVEYIYNDNSSYPITIDNTLVEKFYFSEIPKDPETREAYRYEVYDNGQCYRLSTQLKGVNGESEMKDDGGKDPNLFELGNCLQNSEHSFEMASPPPTPKAKSEAEIREEAIRATENDFRKWFNLPEGKNEERLFDFLGDEIMFGMGETTRFSENDLSLLDIFVGIELSNPEKAKALLEGVFTQMGRNNESGIIGRLFSSNKPIKNTYKEKEFYMIPLGGFFGINIFYIFEGDRLYIVISQNTMNQIIDGMGEEKSFSNSLQRTMAFTGTNKNILLLADLEKLQNIFSEVNEIESYFSEYFLKNRFSKNVVLLSEAWKVEKILNPGATDFSEAKKWYHNLPADFYGIPFVIDSTTLELAMKKDDQIIPIKSISFDYYDRDDDTKQDLMEVLKGRTLETPLQKIAETFRSFGIGFSFTQHGLDIRVAMANPLSKNIDESFSVEKTNAIISGEEGVFQKWGIVFILGSISIIFILILIYLKSSRNPKVPNDQE
jgi:hypothetical protein